MATGNARLESHPVILQGHRVGLRLAGEGPVLVLVHGMTSSSATWARAGALLARRFTIVAPDLLGHGETVTGGGDYSLGAQATLLRDVIVALGHDRATLVGHSFGGGVAMQFAYQYPERCERLVLVGSGGLGLEVNLLLRLLTLVHLDRRIDVPQIRHDERIFSRADEIRMAAGQPRPRRRRAIPEREAIAEPLPLQSGDEPAAIAILARHPSLLAYRHPETQRTFLHMAAARLLPRVATWLLDHGAEVNIQAADQSTPLEVAGVLCNPSIALKASRK